MVLTLRHSKLEAALAEVNWRVRWDDIMFGAMEKKKLERSGSRMSLTRVHQSRFIQDRIKNLNRNSLDYCKTIYVTNILHISEIFCSE